jgi:hypothetical protein
MPTAFRAQLELATTRRHAPGPHSRTARSRSTRAVLNVWTQTPFTLRQ